MWGLFSEILTLEADKKCFFCQEGVTNWQDGRKSIVEELYFDTTCLSFAKEGLIGYAMTNANPNTLRRVDF